MDNLVLRAIGEVRSDLVDAGCAPRQADEGAPPAWLVFAPQYEIGLAGLREGDDVLLLTWLDKAPRDALTVHPRGDTARPPQGVFATRSPARPNPIGLHQVRILKIAGERVQVAALEAINGTPILDLKPVLAESLGER